MGRLGGKAVHQLALQAGEEVRRRGGVLNDLNHLGGAPSASLGRKRPPLLLAARLSFSYLHTKMPTPWSDQPPPPPAMSLKECLLCNLELACLLGGLAAFIWLACQPPPEESADAEASRALQRNGLDWQGLRG